ncbi:Solute carrier family 35 member F4 [Acipenser ruthenus]|uniref:Solute carrier family 35 member F4 n=1 Tax=Acipenser ruthenus TaxID=7906 RepID=A0A444UPT1_ACIRT|nr:Solute carrier family 35 member F4 [Acipenser ruthenus]
MKRSPDVSPRRLSDISPQLRQLKYLVVDESIKEDLKSSRSVEDINSASIGLTSIEERILRITGYYGYQPWTAIYNTGRSIKSIPLDSVQLSHHTCCIGVHQRAIDMLKKWTELKRQTKEKIAQNRSVASGQVELTSLEKNIENIFTPEQQGVQGVTDTTRRKSDSQPGDERPRENLTPAEAQVPAAPDTEGQSVTRCCLKLTASQARKICWGVAVLLGVCLSWTGSTQLAKLAFRKFDAPFTLTWFATNWNFLFFPLYYIGHLYTSTEKQSPRQRYRECCKFFGDDGLTVKVFFTKVAPFGVLWTLTNYLYLHALRKINTTDVSALFCCNKAFVFLLSWIVLRDRFMGVRVLFKLILGSAKFGEAALFLTILGGVNFVFFSFVPVILYFTKVEYFDSIDAVPWGYLCGVSVLLLTFNILVNFGIAVTYPTLISLGIVLSVPVNAAVDHYTSEISFNTVRVIAMLTISLGFLLLLLPEEWDQRIIKLLTRLKVRKKEEAAEGNGEAGPGLSWSRRARSSMSNFTH